MTFFVVHLPFKPAWQAGQASPLVRAFQRLQCWPCQDGFQCGPTSLCSVDVQFRNYHSFSDSACYFFWNVRETQYSILENLFRFVLTNNYFRFGKNFYRQMMGVAMGNRLAPPFAILFMHSLETRYLATAKKSPALLRYIDDIFRVWLHDAESLKHFHHSLNQFHPTIKFIQEIHCPYHSMWRSQRMAPSLQNSTSTYTQWSTATPQLSETLCLTIVQLRSTGK